MIYTHVAAGIAGAALAFTLAWQTQGWRLGKQIESMRAHHAQAVADAKQSAIEEAARMQAQKDEALREANAQAQRNAAAAAAARRESDGLRVELTEARLRMSSSTCASVRDHAATLSAVFDQCVGRLEGMAAQADGHALDARTLTRAWPAQKSPQTPAKPAP